MKIESEMREEGLVVTYGLTEKEKEIMAFAIRNGYVEFRSRTSSEDRTDSSGLCKESECEDLFARGFLERDDDAWHKTLIPTELGMLTAPK